MARHMQCPLRARNTGQLLQKQASSHAGSKRGKAVCRRAGTHLYTRPRYVRLVHTRPWYYASAQATTYVFCRLLLKRSDVQERKSLYSGSCAAAHFAQAQPCKGYACIACSAALSSIHRRS